MNYPTLGTTNGINIHPTRREDLPEFVTWMNNPEIQKTLTSKKRNFTVEGQAKQLAEMESKSPKKILYSIFLRESLIGRLKLSKINWQEKSAHISIMISPDKNLRGKGYGTKALKMFIQLAKLLSIKRLLSKIEETNISSIKIHTKNGFKKDSNSKFFTLNI